MHSRLLVIMCLVRETPERNFQNKNTEKRSSKWKFRHLRLKDANMPYHAIPTHISHHHAEPTRHNSTSKSPSSKLLVKFTISSMVRPLKPYSLTWATVQQLHAECGCKQQARNNVNVCHLNMASVCFGQVTWS